MSSRQRRPRKVATPDRFFQRQLPAGQAPTLATMQTLYVLAMEMSQGAPWKDLVESDAFSFQDRHGQVRIGTISGARLEEQTFYAFRDAGLFHRMQRLVRTGHVEVPDEVIASEVLVSQGGADVELVDEAELSPPDRTLLKALRHPISSEPLHPQFRATAPGFLPWYPTEADAQLLVDGLTALRFLIETLRNNPELDFWLSDESIPLIEPNPATGQLSIRLVPISTQASPPEPAWLASSGEINSALARPQSEPDWAIDHVYAPIPAGEMDRRPYPSRMVLVINPVTPEILHVEPLLPGPSISEALGRGLLGCIGEMEARPARLLVERMDFIPLIEPLASALHIPVVRHRRISVLDRARHNILGNVIGMIEEALEDWEEQ